MQNATRSTLDPYGLPVNAAFRLEPDGNPHPHFVERAVVVPAALIVGAEVGGLDLTPAQFLVAIWVYALFADQDLRLMPRAELDLAAIGRDCGLRTRTVENTIRELHGRVLTLTTHTVRLREVTPLSLAQISARSAAKSPQLELLPTQFDGTPAWARLPVPALLAAARAKGNRSGGSVARVLAWFHLVENRASGVSRWSDKKAAQALGVTSRTLSTARKALASLSLLAAARRARTSVWHVALVQRVSPAAEVGYPKGCIEFSGPSEESPSNFRQNASSRDSSSSGKGGSPTGEEFIDRARAVTAVWDGSTDNDAAAVAVMMAKSPEIDWSDAPVWARRYREVAAEDFGPRRFVAAVASGRWVHRAKRARPARKGGRRTSVDRLSEAQLRSEARGIMPGAPLSPRLVEVVQEIERRYGWVYNGSSFVKPEPKRPAGGPSHVRALVALCAALEGAGIQAGGALGGADPAEYGAQYDARSLAGLPGFILGEHSGDPGWYSAPVEQVANELARLGVEKRAIFAFFEATGSVSPQEHAVS